MHEKCHPSISVHIWMVIINLGKQINGHPRVIFVIIINFAFNKLIMKIV